MLFLHCFVVKSYSQSFQTSGQYPTVAFVPFLTSHYSRIIVIDPREFNHGNKPELDLKAFAAEQGVDDLIVINYPFMINNATYISYLNALIGK